MLGVWGNLGVKGRDYGSGCTEINLLSMQEGYWRFQFPAMEGKSISNCLVLGCFG